MDIEYKGLRLANPEFFDPKELSKAFDVMLEATERLHSSHFLYGGTVFKVSEFGRLYVTGSDFSREPCYASTYNAKKLECKSSNNIYFSRLEYHIQDVNEPLVLVDGAVMPIATWKKYNYKIWSHKIEPGGVIEENKYYRVGDEYAVHMNLEEYLDSKPKPKHVKPITPTPSYF